VLVVVQSHPSHNTVAKSEMSRSRSIQSQLQLQLQYNYLQGT
jgi:hypothetical protein